MYSKVTEERRTKTGNPAQLLYHKLGPFSHFDFLPHKSRETQRLETEDDVVVYLPCILFGRISLVSLSRFDTCLDEAKRRNVDKAKASKRLTMMTAKNKGRGQTKASWFAQLSTTILWNILLVLVVVDSVSAYIPPWEKESLRPLLEQCRLHEPSSSGSAASGLGFVSYASLRFQLINGNLHLSQQGWKNRNELRHNEYFDVGQDVRMRARMVLPEPSGQRGQDADFALMQSHVKDFLGYHRGPLLMVRYMKRRKGIEDHLWVNLREDLRLTNKTNTYYDMGPRPNGIFDLQVEFKDKKVTVKVNDQVRFGPRDVSYFSAIRTNYLKAGLYLTNWDSQTEVQVDDLFMGQAKNDVIGNNRPPNRPTPSPIRTPAPTKEKDDKPDEKPSGVGVSVFTFWRDHFRCTSTHIACRSAKSITDIQTALSKRQRQGLRRDARQLHLGRSRQLSGAGHLQMATHRWTGISQGLPLPYWYWRHTGHSRWPCGQGNRSIAPISWPQSKP